MKFGTIKLYCTLLLFFPVAVQCMGVFTSPNISITPYCEQQDFIGILNIISENPNLKHFRAAQEQKQESCAAIPPLEAFLKNEQSTHILERLALEITHSSHTHVLRVQDKIIGFIRFSSTSRRQLTDATAKVSGNIIAVALAQKFERPEYQERLIRHAMEILLRESQATQIEAIVRTGNKSLHDTYTRLAFSYNREDSSEDCSVYTFVPKHIR